MKTSAPPIRVGITFNAESHPEWYELLSKVVSGRARAEILRTHLTFPSGRFLEKAAVPRQEIFSKKPALQAPALGRNISKGDGDANSPTLIRAAMDSSAPSEKQLQAPVLPAQTHGASAPSAARLAARAQGMAAMLLSQGFDNISES